MKIQLGKRYRDTISGFEGTATARHEYLYGCVRVLLEGRSVEDKAGEELVFDEQRLVEAETAARPTATATSGGPRPTPPRTRQR